MLKKQVLLFGTIILLVIPLVAAQFNLDLRQGAEDLIEMIQETFSPFFEALLNTPSGDYFFAKVMILLLLFFVIFTIVKNIPSLGENRGVVFIIAAVVSVAAVRYMPDETFITSILLPYTTLGTAIAVFLPYLIYLFFVHQSIPGSIFRRAAWVIFGLIFLALWAFKPATEGVSNLINFAGFVLIFAAYIFDRNIHRAFERASLARAVSGVNDEMKSRALANYREMYTNYRDDPINFNKRALSRARKRLYDMSIDVPD